MAVGVDVRWQCRLMCATSLKCALMSAARMAALSRRLTRALGEKGARNLGPNGRIRGEGCVRYVVSVRSQVLKADAYPACETRIAKSKPAHRLVKRCAPVRTGRLEWLRGNPRYRCQCWNRRPGPDKTIYSSAPKKNKAQGRAAAAHRLPTPRKQLPRARSEPRKSDEPWPASARPAPTPGRR